MRRISLVAAVLLAFAAGGAVAEISPPVQKGAENLLGQSSRAATSARCQGATATAEAQCTSGGGTWIPARGAQQSTGIWEIVGLFNMGVVIVLTIALFSAGLYVMLGLLRKGRRATN